MTIAVDTKSSAVTSAGFGEWLDRQSGRIMVLPAVLLILSFAVFPLIISAYLSVSRFALAPGGYRLTFVGFFNFDRLLFGAQQYHFVGTFKPFSPIGWIALVAVLAGLLFWFARYVLSGQATILGFVGRLISASVAVAVVLAMLATVFAGGFPGSFVTTLFYVVAGVLVQFLLGLGLALLCAQPIRGRNWFRVIFFLPLMVTPVGIAYTFRMLADMEKGPFAPLRFALHLGDFTWPAIAPVAATVVLIRLIEAFKIVDLPNVLTNGGPGLATESMTLHSFIAWRTQDLGGSAAIGYILLFISTVTCVSFFNYVVRRARRYQQ